VVGRGISLRCDAVPENASTAWIHGHGRVCRLDLWTDGGEHFGKVPYPFGDDVYAKLGQLLGALMSKDYKFTSPKVGASVMAIPIGAFLAIPFEKEGIVSKFSSPRPPNDDPKFQKKISWSSHMVRRAIFILVLPFTDLRYTQLQANPQFHSSSQSRLLD
jgi:hypothetical protein